MELAEHAVHIQLDDTPVNKASGVSLRALPQIRLQLLVTWFIWEVLHPEWITNPMMVLKHTAKLCMCIDFTRLNKASEGPVCTPSNRSGA